MTEKEDVSDFHPLCLYLWSGTKPPGVGDRSRCLLYEKVYPSIQSISSGGAQISVEFLVQSIELLEVFVADGRKGVGSICKCDYDQ